jgi:hypothetical protein
MNRTNASGARHGQTLAVAWLALLGCSSNEEPARDPVGPSMGIVEVDPNRVELGEEGPELPRGGAGMGGSGSGGAAASGGGGSSGTPLGKIGKPCETSADCPMGLTCHEDTDYIAHLQCTVRCESETTCEEVEPGSFCIGANVCVHRCETNADCGPKTRCGTAGWCERTGPGSGVPYCGGVATPCSLLSDFECGAASGCRDDSECSGSARSCSANFDRYSCEDTAGCYWSGLSERCDGSPHPCSTLLTSLSCNRQSGCIWSGGCGGTPRSCDATLTALCTNQPGCRIVTD